jgi:hypothetical protein
VKPARAIVLASQWLNASRSLVEIVETLPEEPLPGRLLAHFAVVNLRAEIPSLLSGFKRTWGQITIASESDRGALYKIDFEGPTERRHSTLLRLWLVPDAPVALLIAICSNRDWRDGPRRALEALYPKVYSPFLSQTDLRSIFEKMASGLRAKRSIQLTRVSSFKRLLQRSSRKRFESEVLWTDMDYRAAFGRAAEEKSFFKNVAFEVCEPRDDDRPIKSTGTIGVASRDGHFATNASVRWLYHSAIEPLLKEARARSEFLRNRSRVDAPGPAARAIAAQFTGGFKLSREELPRLSSILRKYPDASVSVLHGNPYFDASVVDMRDGSTIELLLASESQMTMLPGLRATESALNRLCRFLYENVGEATFSDPGVGA